MPNGIRLCYWRPIDHCEAQRWCCAYIYSLFLSDIYFHRIDWDRGYNNVNHRRRPGMPHTTRQTTLTETDYFSQILRCWVIYDKSWRIVCLPLILWSFMITGMILLIYWNAVTFYTIKDAEIDNMSKCVLTAVLACNFSNNGYVTCTSPFCLSFWTSRSDSQKLPWLIESCVPKMKCIFTKHAGYSPNLESFIQ